MKKTFLVALLLCGDALATQSASSVTPPVDVDAIAREMAIKAKAIQQQARQDPALTAVAQQAEQITDEQQAAAQALTNDAMKKAASSQTAAQIGKVFGDMKQSDLVAVLPERLVRGQSGLEVVEPPLAVAGFEMLMLWHERWHRDPAHQWLRQFIVNSLEEETC